MLSPCIHGTSGTAVGTQLLFPQVKACLILKVLQEQLIVWFVAFFTCTRSNNQYAYGQKSPCFRSKVIRLYFSFHC